MSRARPAKPQSNRLVSLDEFAESVMGEKTRAAATVLPDAVRHTYVQDGDSCSGEGMQALTVKTADAGGGSYVVIKTRRWAIDADGIDDFAAMLRAALAAVKS